jgi:hypothetical protein
MPAVLNKTELAFTSDCAKGFVLGTIRNAFSTEISIASIKERVLWQWGDTPAHSDELLQAIFWLAEQKYIKIIGPHSMMERNSVCVLRRT